MTTTTANTARTSRPPTLTKVRAGSSTTHDGSESAVMVRASAWDTSQLR